jgi:hypothetical protein
VKPIHFLITTIFIMLLAAGVLDAQEPGDVNNDSSIDIIDALLTAQYYVGLNPSTFDPANADVNCGGSIDIVDALLIAQYYVGLISVFPCGTPEPTPIQPPQTYYVDSQYGNDVNDGRSSSSPWENCPGMPDWSGTAELQAGDTVYFNSGSTWTASTGDALIAVTGGVVYNGRSWGTGTRAVLRAAGDLNRSVVNVREDHPDVPTEVIGFEIDARGYITTGIGVNWPHSVPRIDGAVKRFVDCIVHGAYSEANQNEYEYGIAISSGYGGNCAVENIEIIDCVTYDISRGGINIYSANDDPASYIKNILVRGCDISGSGQDPSYAGSQLNMKNHIINCTFEYNYVHNAERGAGISFSTHPEEGFRGPENCIMRYNIVTGSKHAGILFGGEGAMSLEIYGNLISNNFYSSFRMLSGLNAVMRLKVYNNTFYKSVSDPPGDWSPEVSIDDNPSLFETFEFKNNIVYSTEFSPALIDNVGCFTDHSNNIYYREGESNPQLMRVAGTYYSQTEVDLFEPTGIHANPLFKSPGQLPTGFIGTFGSDLRPDSDGLSLLAESSAIDAGAPLGSPYDGSINSVKRPSGSGWDIGAYE